MWHAPRRSIIAGIARLLQKVHNWRRANSELLHKFRLRANKCHLQPHRRRHEVFLRRKSTVGAEPGHSEVHCHISRGASRCRSVRVMVHRDCQLRVETRRRQSERRAVLCATGAAALCRGPLVWFLPFIAASNPAVAHPAGPGRASPRALKAH